MGIEIHYKPGMGKSVTALIYADKIYQETIYAGRSRADSSTYVWKRRVYKESPTYESTKGKRLPMREENIYSFLEGIPIGESTETKSAEEFERKLKKFFRTRASVDSRSITNSKRTH
jgi:hypothetical protein